MLLRELFDSISDYQTPASHMFLKDLFGILQTIIIDGTPDKAKAIKNLDALELVLRLVCSECNIEVRRRAVLCVQELLIMDVFNVVCLRKVCGFDALLKGMTAIQMPRGMEGAVLHSRPEYKLLEEIREVLSYSAVVLSKHDSHLFEDILARGMTNHRMDATVRQMLLSCSCDLLRDRNARKLPPVSVDVVNNVVKCLRAVLHADTPLSPRHGRLRTLNLRSQTPNLKPET